MDMLSQTGPEFAIGLAGDSQSRHSARATRAMPRKKALKTATLNSGLAAGSISKLRNDVLP
jgi:hypothetical protein